MSTEPVREGHELLYHPNGYTKNLWYEVPGGDSYESQTAARSTIEEKFDCTNTNLFPETDFDLNRTDSLSLPHCSPPSLLRASDTLEEEPLVSTSSKSPGSAESSLSSSARSETSKTPHTTIYSTSPGNASLVPSDPMGSDDGSAKVAISKSSALRCAECPQAFASTSLLERHSRSHTRFACTKGCAKSFTVEKDRRRHESTIHGNQNPQCEVCGRKLRKDNMRRHMKLHERGRSQNPTRSEQDT